MGEGGGGRVQHRFHQKNCFGRILIATSGWVAASLRLQGSQHMAPRDREMPPSLCVYLQAQCDMKTTRNKTVSEQEEIRGTTTKHTTPQQHDHLLLLRLLLRLLLPLALSHCTFIKRFIISQAFSDSLRPILCETETQILSHKHARTCAHMHKHAQSAQMNILFYFFD